MGGTSSPRSVQSRLKKKSEGDDFLITGGYAGYKQMQSVRDTSYSVAKAGKQEATPNRQSCVPYQTKKVTSRHANRTILGAAILGGVELLRHADAAYTEL